ncbi:hypothetical protein FXO37_14987 [Capsicum annuum]|nr:hypothetical protein FXO37_14987 [Capsicum annuum]
MISFQPDAPKNACWYHLPDLLDGSVNYPMAPAFHSFLHILRHYPTGDDPVHTYSVGVGEGGDHSGPDLRALTPASLEGRFEPPTLAHHGKQAYR